MPVPVSQKGRFWGCYGEKWGGSIGDDGAEARSVDVIEVLESDDEVRLAKSPWRRNNPLNAPDVDLTNNDMVFVRIDLQKIIEQPLKVGCVEASHVKTMERKLHEDGYLGSSGSISIDLQDTGSCGRCGCWRDTSHRRSTCSSMDCRWASPSLSYQEAGAAYPAVEEAGGEGEGTIVASKGNAAAASLVHRTFEPGIVPEQCLLDE